MAIAQNAVFGLPELFDEIIGYVAQQIYNERDMTFEHDNIDDYTAEDFLLKDPEFAYVVTAAKVSRVCRLWRTMIVSSSIIQQHAYLSARKANGRGWHTSFSKKPILNVLVEILWAVVYINILPSGEGTANSQLHLLVDDTDLKHIQSFRSSWSIFHMLVSQPPPTLLKVTVPYRMNAFPQYGNRERKCRGNDIDGEWAHVGSTLSVHHKESGFTFGDLVKIAKDELEGPRRCEMILIKSMDHLSEKRRELFKAQCEE